MMPKAKTLRCRTIVRETARDRKQRQIDCQCLWAVEERMPTQFASKWRSTLSHWLQNSATIGDSRLECGARASPTDSLLSRQFSRSRQWMMATWSSIH